MTPTSLGGYHIDRGVEVTVNIAAMHYDPKYFTQPLHFNPERLSSMSICIDVDSF